MPDKKDVKIHIYPKAKAQSRSSGSHERPTQYAWPARFVDAAPYNGTGAYAIPIEDEEEEAPRRRAVTGRPRNSIRQSDVNRANETLAGMGPNVGRGHRRR